MNVLTHRGIRRGRSARSFRVAMLALVCVGVVALAPSAALANSAQNISTGAGLGVGSALATLVYAPCKLIYAGGGLVVGGLAWVFSGGDRDVAKIVLTPSVLGDYVVTPAQLRGEQPLEFFGRDPNYSVSPANVAAAPPEEISPETDGW
jgi:hypothetical protein